MMAHEKQINLKASLQNMKYLNTFKMCMQVHGNTAQRINFVI